MSRTTLLLSLCAALAFAGNERITREIVDQPAGEVAKLLNAHFKIELRLTGELDYQRITVAFEDATHAQALRKLAAALEQPLHRRGSGLYLIGADWRASLRRQLESHRVNGNSGRTLEDFVKMLRSRWGKDVNMFLDPVLRSRVESLRVGRMSMKSVLDLIAAHYDCAWDLRYGVVFISTRERLARLPVRSPLWDAPFPNRRTEVHYRDDPVSWVMDSIRQETGVPVEIAADDREAARRAPVALWVKNMHYANILALSLLPVGWTAEFEKGRLHVRRTSGDVTPARDDWRKGVRRQLEAGCGQGLRGRTLKELMEQIRSRTTINVFVDPELRERSGQLHYLGKGNLTDVLDAMATRYECAWDLRYGAVFVATKTRLAALPKKSPFLHPDVPDRVVDNPYRDSYLYTVLKALGRQGRLDIRAVAGPPTKAATRIKVSAYAKNVRLADALALVLLPIGWTAEIEKGRIRVRPAS